MMIDDEKLMVGVQVSRHKANTDCACRSRGILEWRVCKSVPTPIRS